jgi:hypothetical protein
MAFGKLSNWRRSCFGALCLHKASAWGLAPLTACMFLLTTQAAFFSPAFNGILPETFKEGELSRANGDAGMASFLATILGYGAAPLMLLLSGDSSSLRPRAGDASILGLVATMRVEPGRRPFRRKASALWESSAASLIVGFKAMCQTRPILLAALGDAYFLAAGSAVQTLVVMLAKYGLARPCGPLETGILLVAPASASASAAS